MSIFQKFVLRSLKENKVRTLVTIIGIVLSVSMLTAVTTGVSSFQDFMLRVVEQEYGSWHVYFVKLQKEGLEQIKVDEEVESFGIINNVGYAKLENPLREDCSYLYVGAYEENFLPLTGEQIIEGREPKNSNEIIIPNLLLENEELGYKVGDTITLSLGERKSSEGETLWQSNYYMEEGEESFSEIGEKKYTIVGVYQGGHIDSAYLPGYNVLTKADDKISSETSISFRSSFTLPL